MKRLVAIHQPNFFPWLGFFDKIRRADTFIFLDGVDYPRAGSASMASWTNRVKLAIQGEARWVTCPIKRMASGCPIYAAEINDSIPWRKKFMKTLDANYKRARNFDSTVALLDPLINQHQSKLADFNINAVTTIADRLGLETRFVRQTDLAAVGSSTELLISLVKEVDGTQYLSGGGASGYQNDPLFEENGIELLYQNYNSSPYMDNKQFIPGLSVIDYLMHQVDLQSSA